MARFNVARNVVKRCNLWPWQSMMMTTTFEASNASLVDIQRTLLSTFDMPMPIPTEID